MTIIAVAEDKIRGMESMDGLVLQGCGGSPEEWADGINKMPEGSCHIYNRVNRKCF